LIKFAIVAKAVLLNLLRSHHQERDYALVTELFRDAKILYIIINL